HRFGWRLPVCSLSNGCFDLEELESADDCQKREHREQHEKHSFFHNFPADRVYPRTTTRRRIETLRSGRGFRPTKTTSGTHSFPKFLPLFRRHLRVALEHPALPRRAVRPSKSAEKDLAQDEQTEGLPISDR